MKIKQKGSGTRNSEKKVSVSDSLDLEALRARAEANDLKLSEFFSGAVIAAYSKLDVSETEAPS